MQTLNLNPLFKKFSKTPILIGLFFIVGIIGFWFSTKVRNPYTLLYPLALLLGPLMYLGLQHQSELEVNISKSILILKVGLIVYTTFFVALILAYHNAGFYRSAMVFHLTFGLYAVTAVLIWLRPTPIFSLLLLCTTGIVNRLTGYYASALYVGTDYYTHYPWIERIVQEGSLMALQQDKYFYAPVYHLLTAIAKMMAAVPVKDAGAIATVFPVTVVPVLVVFILNRYFWDLHVATMGGFLYMASDYAIQQGHYAVTTSLGLVLFSVLLLVIFRFDQEFNPIFGILLIVFILIISMTHQVSLFITTVFIGAYFGTRAIYELNFQKHLIFPIFCGITLFIDFAITRRAGPSGDSTFLDTYLGLVIFRYLEQSGTTVRQEVSLPTDPSISGIGAAGLDTVQVLGSAILLCFGIVGSLYWLQSSYNSQQHFFALRSGICLGVMYAFVLGLPIIAIGDLLPTRWFPFIYILLAILAAPAFVALIRTILSISNYKNILAVLIIVIAVTLPYIVLMGGNYVGASDDPYFDDAPDAERFGITLTEDSLFDHTVQYHENMTVLADRRAAGTLSRYYGINANPFQIRYKTTDSLQRPSLVVERAYIHTPQSQYHLRYEGQRHTVAGAFPIEEISSFEKQAIYNSGNDKLIYLSDDSSETP